MKNPSQIFTLFFASLRDDQSCENLCENLSWGSRGFASVEAIFQSFRKKIQKLFLD